jgi:putative NADPH-quinone reductase
MNVSVILAHPSRDSFNHAIAEAAVRQLRGSGHVVRFHDLYAEGFDPILQFPEIEEDDALPQPIAQHCLELTEAGGIIIVHPNWWGQPPAILKGWIDRVIRPGIAYEFLEGDAGEGVPNGLLRAEKVLIFNTSNTPARREREVFGDPLELLWRNCVFDLCGVGSIHRRMFSVIVVSSEAQRLRWLEEVKETVAESFPATQ